MALTVTRVKVKEKARISDSSLDTVIDNLILDWVPVLEYAVEPSLLTSSEAGLVATLNLAATEVIAGELLAMLAREPGALDEVQIGSLRLRPMAVSQVDPSGLRSQGWSRLSPFTRVDASPVRMAVVAATAGKETRE